MTEMESFKLLATQYSAAPPPANTRHALTIRGFDAAERKQLHRFVAEVTPNLTSGSVNDRDAPRFPNQPMRSITLGRNRDSQMMNNCPSEMAGWQALHPGLRVPNPLTG